MSLVYTPWDAPKNYKLFNFNYGQDKEPQSDADGYYSAHSEDGIVFTDDVLTNPALPASGAGNPNHPDGPENHGDVSNFVFDFHRDECFATIKQFFVVNTSTDDVLKFGRLDVRQHVLDESREVTILAFWLF